MPLRASLHKRVFEFSFNARTSRGAMKEKISWFIKVWDESNPAIVGMGECGPLPGLSPEYDSVPDWEPLIEEINQETFDLPTLNGLTEVNTLINKLLHGKKEINHSSLLFGLETALLDWSNGGTKLIFSGDFLKGKPIPINGLIWMGGLDFMLQQIELKIRDGFTCLKLKVGGHDFEKECDVLQYIRRKYFRDKITIRLDANGAFKKENALNKLKELSRFGIHSIEQPIKPGMTEMEELCRQSPIPVALDEELIGVTGLAKRRTLLSRIKPPYIILKPSLHGGLFSCQEWIRVCEELGIAWWITSALESNIGLNAIAQFTSQYNVVLSQGLGTGQIYSNNIDSPLTVENGQLHYNKAAFWGKIDD
jgi:O-succinylbenzoate synthase